MKVGYCTLRSLCGKHYRQLQVSEANQTISAKIHNMVTFSDVFVVLLKRLIGLIDLVYSMFMNCMISCTFHLLVALPEHIHTYRDTFLSLPLVPLVCTAQDYAC